MGTKANTSEFGIVQFELFAEAIRKALFMMQEQLAQMNPASKMFLTLHTARFFLLDSRFFAPGKAKCTLWETWNDLKVDLHLELQRLSDIEPSEQFARQEAQVVSDRLWEILEPYNHGDDQAACEFTEVKNEQLFYNCLVRLPEWEALFTIGGEVKIEEDNSNYGKFCIELAAVFLALASEFEELRERLLYLGALLTKDNRSIELREIRNSYLALCRGTEHLKELHTGEALETELETFYCQWVKSFAEYPRLNIGMKGLNGKALAILDSRRFNRYLKAAMESVDLHTMS